MNAWRVDSGHPACVTRVRILMVHVTASVFYDTWCERTVSPHWRLPPPFALSIVLFILNQQLATASHNNAAPCHFGGNGFCAVLK